MRIGIFTGNAINRCAISYNDGSFSVFADSLEFGSILPNEFVDLEVSGNYIILRKGVTVVGQFKRILLIQNYSNKSLTITPRDNKIKPRKYKDHLEISVLKGSLCMVNLVDLNNYLAGVVESEGGGGKSLEYYKVQALMSRTYALKYKNKHVKDGYQLCDRVHCQAYHSMLRFTPLIDSAVRSTDGDVMLDESGELVDAYFHANCGGQTSQASYVWNTDVKYLSSFRDTFCIYTKQATWRKEIPKSDWLTFLATKYNYPIHDTLFKESAFLFEQNQRVAFFKDPVLGIPLRDIREKFGLKSTFFNCRPEGNFVVLEGRGYGHGVGLCQEGAMKMGDSGFDYYQIALFYFPKITIVNQYTSDFFNQKVQQIQF